jgi:DNA-binding transcriptional regulator YiaG
MTADEFRRRIAALGFNQRGFAAYVGANERTVRRWADEDQDIPRWVPVMLDLMETVRQRQAAE